MASSRSKSAEAYQSRYKSSKTWEKNRLERLMRAQKAQPNNKQIEEALKGGFVYRRKTPKAPAWSHTAIRIAKLFKEFEGRFDKNILHPDPKVSQVALSTQSKVSKEILREKQKPKQSNESFFSIATRLKQ